MVGQQVGRQLQAAVTAQGQLGTVFQVHRHCPGRAGFQLFPGIKAVAFHQGTSTAIGRYREYLADNLADHTDQISHEHASIAEGFRNHVPGYRETWRGQCPADSENNLATARTDLNEINAFGLPMLRLSHAAIWQSAMSQNFVAIFRRVDLSSAHSKPNAAKNEELYRTP